MKEITIRMTVKTANGFGKIVGRFDNKFVVVIPDSTTARGYYVLNLLESEFDIPDLVWTEYPDWDE